MKKQKKIKCFWCNNIATVKDWREIDGTIGSYPSCRRCFNLSTEYLLKMEKQGKKGKKEIEKIMPISIFEKRKKGVERLIHVALGLDRKYTCLKCGRYLIPVKDGMTDTYTGHLWICTCFPEGIRLSIG